MITAVVILIGVIAIAAYLTYTFDKDDKLPTAFPYTKEELKNIKLAEELYDKDLRQVVTKKPKIKPTPKPISNNPEFIENTTENKQTNSEFPIDKPKKKRKYYPKKKKQ